MKPVSEFRHTPMSLESTMGSRYIDAVKSAYGFLKETSTDGLRSMVGQTLEFIPDFEQVDKRAFVESYQKPIQDDVLVGYGMFKITERKMLQIDWTGGNYQLPLGYHFLGLDNLLPQARELGIVDDTHNNTPGMAVKLLASQLVKCANIFDGEVDDEKLKNILDDDDRLNRVASVDTGTVAAGTALKSILYRFRELHGDCVPVFIMQEGNYHGTDFLEQRLRGMWEWLFTNLIVEFVKPNDVDGLGKAFRKYKNSKNEKIAAAIMEPVLMNNRAIYLNPEYVKTAKELCIQHDAILFLDEIQTGMWSPSVLVANEYHGVADVIAVGKGLTNGFSPLAYMICKKSLDNQDQYSSISTNGNADMAALAGLIVLESVKSNANHIEAVGSYYFDELRKLQKTYPDKISEITGHRHLAGINIVNGKLAVAFHQACLAKGIFLRLQSYKVGASTIITKPAVITGADDVDFVIDELRIILEVL
ncbi:aminotransferase class III-fold pyridoxal phosphate-dependent enzyme [Candidatus Poribacteria bacterium]